MRHAAVLFAGFLLVAGCATQPSGPPPGFHAGPGRGGPRGGEGRGVFISPMGEPFRGSGGRTALIGQWFDAADADHDGHLTPAEFTADALRFFKMLDADHDGEIDPAELRHYETDVAPEIRVGDAGGARSGARGGGGGRGGGRGGHGGGGGGRRGGGDASGGAVTPHQSLGVEGAARYGLLDLPEPVAAADADFNRSITAREFTAAAAARFDALDADGDGYLTKAKLLRR